MKYLKYLQIKYKHLGRGWSYGDCFNILRLYYQHELGITIEDKTDYREDWDSEDYFVTLAEQWGFRKVALPKPNDVVLLRGRWDSTVSHCGVVINSTDFIHTSKSGTAIASFITGPWADLVHGFYRHTDFV